MVLFYHIFLVLQITARKMSAQPKQFYVRLRGLPYSATEGQIRAFFEGLTILENGITFTSSTNGRPSGECYCEFSSFEEVKEALKKDRENLGSRYVEIFEVGGVELEQIMRRKHLKENTAKMGFIRVRGLPYNCKKEDMVEFFQGLTVEDVVFGKEQGIEGGRATGEGFIAFASNEEADRALQLNGKHLGTRYLEIFKSDGEAYEQFKDRSTRNIVPLRAIPALADWGANMGGYGGGEYAQGGGYDGYGNGGYGEYNSYYNNGNGGAYGGKMGGMRGRGGRGGGETPGMGGPNRYSPYGQPYNQQQHGSDMGGSYGYVGGRGGYGYARADPYANTSPTKVFIRGLPFRVTAKEIEDFFAPLVCVSIQTGTQGDGRSSGDGIVEFETAQDAQTALQKDRQNIGSRYVELYSTTATKIPSMTRYERIGGKGRPTPAAAPAPTPMNAVGYEDMGWGQQPGAPAPGYGAPRPTHPAMGYERPAGAPSFFGSNGNEAGNGGGYGTGYGGGYGNGGGAQDYSWPTTY